MFDFANLDEKTRSYMLRAIEEAEHEGQIDYSPRLNTKGKEQWLGLLEQAAREHTEHWLAYELEANRLIKGFEVSERPLGSYSIKHVPRTAAQTMAEGQFNRFYMLGLCKRARDEGVTHLEVYRAKQSARPRPESQALIGIRLPVEIVEPQLRDDVASQKSLLIQPNSGISLRLPDRK
jgi:hypothetical protein